MILGALCALLFFAGLVAFGWAGSEIAGDWVWGVAAGAGCWLSLIALAGWSGLRAVLSLGIRRFWKKP